MDKLPGENGYSTRPASPLALTGCAIAMQFVDGGDHESHSTTISRLQNCDQINDAMQE